MKKRKNIPSVILILLVSLFFLTPSSKTKVWAQEETKGDLQFSIDTRFQTTQEEDKSAKFQEYRDIRDGFILDELKARYEDKGNKNYFDYLDFSARNVQLDDQNISFEAGSYGKYKLQLNYDEIPHRFGNNGKTLFTGEGSGSLKISDAIQTALQGTTSGNPSALMKSYMTGAHDIDLELFRRKGGGSLEYNLPGSLPLNLKLDYSRENRDGTRPFFAPFGFGSTIELPEPIDYTTQQVKAQAQYVSNPYLFSAAYNYSKFENHIDTLTWDNPYRIDDSTTSSSYTHTNQSGSSRGRIDLYPDNSAHELTLTGSRSKLPFDTRVTGTVSYGWRTQTDDMIAHTINGAIIAAHPEALEPVGEDVDGKVKTGLYNLLVTSRPLKPLSVDLRARHYRFKNDTDRLTFEGYTRMDGVWEEEEIRSTPYEYDKTTTGVDVGYDLASITPILKNTKAKFSYTYDKMNRDKREVDKTKDDIYKVSLDTSPYNWLTVRASYEHTKRDISDYFFKSGLKEGEPEAYHAGENPPVLPLLRKYDESDKDRDVYQFQVTVTPQDNLNISTLVQLGKDDYAADFGITDDKQRTYALDLDYTPIDKLTLFAFYSYERHRTSEKGRQWTPGGKGDPFVTETGIFSYSNWTSIVNDNVHTIGAGLKLGLIPDRLDFSLRYSYSKTEGKVDLSSPLGTSAVDSNPRVPGDLPNTDDTKYHLLNAELKGKINKNLSLGLGYSYERYRFSDFATEGLQRVPVNPTTGAYAGALFLGTGDPDYTAHTAYLKLMLRF